MNRILAVNEMALTVTVQAGMRGDAFEYALDQRGYSMGNFPQSIDSSTVGGWVATRASGQFSTLYGSIEDMLIGFEAVLASGEVVRLRPAARRSAGPDLCALFLGSEGTLGVLTELTARIHPCPEHRRLASYAFDSVHAGLEATRRVMRAGWHPAVIRLYDEIETARHFSAYRESGCILLVLSEGPRTGVEAEAEAVALIVREAGGVPCGEAPVTSWLKHRNTVPTWDQLFDQGLIADTIEVTASWDQAARVYDAVTAALREVPELLAASGHSSHSYPQGTCLYITLVIHPADLASGEPIYQRCWDAALRATLAAGGTISHHHGIGRLRRQWLEQELGSAYRLLPALKRALDPNGILNPGVLV
jgi:alkyldihydroxyacetonephosphate synthase